MPKPQWSRTTDVYIRALLTGPNREAGKPDLLCAVGFPEVIDEHDAIDLIRNQQHRGFKLDRIYQKERSTKGEFGAKLSGGQRQRITIARAILKDASVLVFDEATSALDARTERALQDALDALRGKRTVFVIAHRLSTIRRADRIVVLERGRVRQQGRHDELLAESGLYRELAVLSDESGAREGVDVHPAVTVLGHSRQRRVGSRRLVQVHNEDDLELEPFGGMYRHEVDGVYRFEDRQGFLAG